MLTAVRLHLCVCLCACRDAYEYECAYVRAFVHVAGLSRIDAQAVRGHLHRP